MEALPSRRLPKLLLAIFIALAGAISGVAYWYHRTQKQALEREVGNQLLTIADTKVRQLTDWRAQHLDHVRLILSDQMTLTVLHRMATGRAAASEKSQAQAWLEGLCRELHYANAFLTDEQGEILAHAGRPFGSAPHIRELARREIVGTHISLSDLHMAPGVGIHLGLNLGLRLTPGSPAFGTLLLAIDPADYLYPLIQGWPVPSRTAETLLVRREGGEVVFLNDLRHRKNTAMRMRLPLNQTDVPAVKGALGFEGVTEGHDYRGAPVFAAIRKVPGTDWSLIAKIDSEEVHAPLRWRSRVLDTAAVSLILAAGAIVMYWWRRQQMQTDSLFRSTFEQAAVGMNHVSPDGRYVRVNPRFCEITGYSRQELLAIGPLEITHPDDRAQDAQRIAQLNSGVLVAASWNKRFVHKSGAIIWARLSVSAMHLRSRQPVLLIALVEDITEQVRAEEALRCSEERFRIVVEHAPDAILVETGLRFRFANAEAVRIFGAASAADLIGTPVLDRIHPAERDEVERRSRRVAAGNPAGRAERRCLTMNGDTVFIEASLVPIDYDGQPSGLVFLRDIAERKRNEAEKATLEEQLRHAQKMESVGRLAGGVAHDFNNLLTIINGYSDMLLERDLPGDDDLRDGISEIRLAGARAASLTQQLLTFSRKEMADPKPINLNDVVQEERKLLERLIGEDVQIVTRLDSSIGPVMADRSHIHQVLMNLTVNARDAMPAGGRLVIETAVVDQLPAQARCENSRPGEHVLLAVTDTGEGMTQETLAKIFEPFFTTKQRGSGTGLGLSTVYGIVRQSGGCIQVSSELGKGSKFTIYFPRTMDSAPVRERPPVPVSVPGHETILVVEDQAEVRKLALSILSSNGYRLLAAAHGAEALEVEAANRGPIDLLITDLVMPGMSGRELAGRMKQKREDMKVLFISGYPDDFIGRQGVLEPGVAYLSKPFTPAELSMRVREVLNNPEPATILVIDDDEAVRDLLANALEKAGYHVLLAANGRDGCRVLEENRADLVITDLVMPEQEGLETLRWVRSHREGLPVLTISGAFQGEFLRAAKLLGADAVLQKPIEPGQLLPLVGELLKR